MNKYQLIEPYLGSNIYEEYIPDKAFSKCYKEYKYLNSIKGPSISGGGGFTNFSVLNKNTFEKFTFRVLNKNDYKRQGYLIKKILKKIRKT